MELIAARRCLLQQVGVQPALRGEQIDVGERGCRVAVQIAAGVQGE